MHSGQVRRSSRDLEAQQQTCLSLHRAKGQRAGNLQTQWRNKPPWVEFRQGQCRFGGAETRSQDEEQWSYLSQGAARKDQTKLCYTWQWAFHREKGERESFKLTVKNSIRVGAFAFITRNKAAAVKETERVVWAVQKSKLLISEEFLCIIGKQRVIQQYDRQQYLFQPFNFGHFKLLISAEPSTGPVFIAWVILNRHDYERNPEKEQQDFAGDGKHFANQRAKRPGTVREHWKSKEEGVWTQRNERRIGKEAKSTQETASAVAGSQRRDRSIEKAGEARLSQVHQVKGGIDWVLICPGGSAQRSNKWKKQGNILTKKSASRSINHDQIVRFKF